MTAGQLQAVGPALSVFLQRFERFFDSPATVHHFRSYTRGPDAGHSLDAARRLLSTRSDQHANPPVPFLSGLPRSRLFRLKPEPTPRRFRPPSLVRQIRF
jgi:hypothetical protein